MPINAKHKTLWDPDLVFVWAGVVTFTERLVTHFSGNKTHEAGGHYANDGPYLCPDTSSEKYKWRRNTLCHTQPVARREIWGLELSLKMFTLTKRGLTVLVSFSYSSNMFTIFEQVSVYDHQTWDPQSHPDVHVCTMPVLYIDIKNPGQTKILCKNVPWQKKM